MLSYTTTFINILFLFESINHQTLFFYFITFLFIEFNIFIVIGAKEVYITKWFAFKNMLFLEDKDQPRPTLSTEVVSTIINFILI